MEQKLKFGEIPGIKIGDIFNSRKELYASGLHMQIQAGIWGWQDEGACSIVLSDGYEDDIDELNYILYTGNLRKVQTEGKYKGKSKEVAL